MPTGTTSGHSHANRSAIVNQVLNSLPENLRELLAHGSEGTPCSWVIGNSCELVGHREQSAHGELNCAETVLTSQMQLVMEGMGLKQYMTVIQKEKIDGEIFLELDETTLTQELGVTSRIHRLKLLKLIGGEYSAHTYYKEQATPV